MALVREGIDISLWSKSLTLFLVTAKETKKLIACLQLHSRLMGGWDFQFLPLLLFSLYLFACWDRYAGQMPREMWCNVHSSYSLGFPWWEIRSRSWNVIAKLFKICTHAWEHSLCWWCWLCLHVCVCSGKQPTVTVLSSILASRWSILGRTVLPAASPHWGATACDNNSCVLSWAFISNSHLQWPRTGALWASHPSLSCGSPQQEAPACLWLLQFATADWSSVVGQVCSHWD